MLAIGNSLSEVFYVWIKLFEGVEGRLRYFWMLDFKWGLEDNFYRRKIRENCILLDFSD